MTNENAGNRAWELMEKIGVCMLITQKQGESRARPMTATIERDRHAIYFLTDAGAQKDSEVEANPSVLLAFADPHSQQYVAVTGIASVSDDRSKIKDIWTPLARAWWDSADDPDIRLVTVRPQSAEFWDSPGTVASHALFAATVTVAKSKIRDGVNASQ